MLYQTLKTLRRLERLHTWHGSYVVEVLHALDYVCVHTPGHIVNLTKTCYVLFATWTGLILCIRNGFRWLVSIWSHLDSRLINLRVLDLLVKRLPPLSIIMGSIWTSWVCSCMIGLPILVIIRSIYTLEPTIYPVIGVWVNLLSYIDRFHVVSYVTRPWFTIFVHEFVVLIPILMLIRRQTTRTHVSHIRWLEVTIFCFA